MTKRGLLAALVILAAGPALAADPATIDWPNIPTNTVKLFFPGQSTYQWLRSSEHKRAQKETIKGEACVSCHEDEEGELGQTLVSGDRLEPHPIDGKQAVIDLGVQVAHDSENLYFRYQWKTRNEFPGSAHPHWIYDGKDWKVMGWPRLHKNVWDDGKPAIYEDRLSMMVDDGSVPMFAEQGCWLTCHDGMRDSPDVASKDDTMANPLIGGVLKKSDVRKYLPSTRSDDNATWHQTKSAEEVAAIKAAGGFVDLMQWRGHRSNPIGMADDGYVLEYRLSDAGKGYTMENDRCWF